MYLPEEGKPTGIRIRQRKNTKIEQQTFKSLDKNLVMPETRPDLFFFLFGIVNFLWWFYVGIGIPGMPVHKRM
jgi:hypothetical protein